MFVFGKKYKCEAIPKAAKELKKPPNPQRGNRGLTIDELTIDELRFGLAQANVKMWKCGDVKM
jgi:hypothetical protein